MSVKKIETPVTSSEIESLRSGETVSLSGLLIAARDAAHKRIIRSLEMPEPLPFDLKDQIVFYLGPSPVPPGRSSGSIGPTTGSRMDGLTEPLLKAGVRAFIGKGKRSDGLKDLLRKYKAVYFVAPGGVAAYLGQKVKRIEAVAYDDLGPEAVYELEVVDFPLVVAYDIYGGDIFSPG